LTVATVHAQEDPPFTGTLTIDGVQEVPAGTVLRLGPGAVLTGSGRLDVHGVLEAVGAPDSRVEISVPIVLDGNGTSRLVDARVWGVAGAGLTLRAGNLTLSRASFEGNGIGLWVAAAGDARVMADEVTFRAHASEGARIVGAADASFSRTSFADNLRGLVLDLGARPTPADVRVSDSLFTRNGAHLVVDLGNATARASVVVERNDFGATTPIAGSARIPSVTVNSSLAQDSGESVRNVSLARNSLHDGDVALRVEGAGFALSSEYDAFRANRVGLSVSLASVRVVGSAFDDVQQDIDAAGTTRLTTEGVTFAAVRNAPAPLASDATPGLAWWGALLGAVALAGGGALALRGRGRAPLARRDADEAPPPPPDLSVPLRPAERRVVEDIAAHPGTAQSAVAARLGMTRQALHYHVKKLEARGLIVKEAHGRETRCSVPDAVSRALASEASPTVVTRPDGDEKE
jgi:hypothetical protein